MLTIRNLTKSYQNTEVVNHFNLKIEEGHIYGIVGPNGAGKTTFFKLLAGLSMPASGEITVSTGEAFEGYRKKMSFMIENPYLYDGMTAFENMKIIGGIKGETDENNLKKLLELVGLDKTGKKKVKNFSLGMRQRLGIACALTSNPEILVLDEPMNGIDPEGIVELRELLWALNRERNITLLISSHILGEVFQLSTDFIFIKGGHIINIIDKESLENTGGGIHDMSQFEQYYMKEMGENADKEFV